MKEAFHKFQDKYHTLPPVLQTLGLVLLFGVGQGLIPVLLFLYSGKLGYWWFVLLVIYLIFLIASIGYLLKRKEMLRIRLQYGDDFYFNAFPKEKEKEEKKKARKRA